MKPIICTVVVLFMAALAGRAHAQCACMGGASVGGAMPIGGAAAIGVLGPGQFRASAQYRYGAGHTYFRGATKAETGPVVSYRTQYLGFMAGYGITGDITLETELGYYLEKYQDFSYTTATGHGPSHIGLSGKYNIYQSEDGDFEATLGAGGRAPLEIGESNLPQHVLPSTGAYGAFAQGFVQQQFPGSGFRLALSHRSDFSAENRLGYTYGAGFFTSIYAIWTAAESVTALVEIRNEIRSRDKRYGAVIDGSGSNVFIVSHQVGYAMGQFYISALADFPFYRYYNGHQLANDFSLALNLTWQFQLGGE